MVSHQDLGQSLVQSLAWVRPITHQFCHGWMSQEYRIQSNLDMPYIHRWRTKAFQRSQNDYWTAQNWYKRPSINLAIFSQIEKARNECKMPQKNTEISSALINLRMTLKHLSRENFWARGCLWLAAAFADKITTNAINWTTVLLHWQLWVYWRNLL